MSHKEGLKSQTITTVRLCLFVLLASASVMGQAASPSPAAQPAKSGKITGKVVNEKGQPLSNARVVVRPVGSNVASQTTFTDREGKFELGGLERVNFQLSAWVSAYVPIPRDPAAAQTSNYRVGDSATLVLTKGGVITGTVTTQTGEPLVGVYVHAKMIRGADLLPWSMGGQPFGRLSDDRGVYRIYGLPAGTYIVWAGGAGGTRGVDPGEAEVRTYSPSSARDTAAEITVSAGEETSNVDIRYRGELGRVVSGTATGPTSDPQMGYSVELTSVIDGDTQWASMIGGASQQARGFAFQGVDDGDYYVTARSLVGAGEWAFSVPKRITVRGADVTGLELVTQLLGSVTGRVVLQESNAPECTDKERPVFSEALVSAWHKQTQATKELPRFIWSSGAPASPDADGNVKLRNLAPGDYRFATQFSGKYWYLQSISLASKTKPVDATRVWTTVKSGDRISGLTVTLAHGAASLRGKVEIAEGEALPEKLFVYLVPAEREKADEVLRYFAVAVTPDGKIALNNLAPGRYFILAQRAIDDVSPPLTQIRLPDSTELRSKLRRDAEAAKTEIEFKPCQNVSDYRLKL